MKGQDMEGTVDVEDLTARAGKLLVKVGCPDSN